MVSLDESIKRLLNAGRISRDTADQFVSDKRLLALTSGPAVPLAIRCQNLVKTYAGRPPVEAVRGIDLEVEQGQCFGVLGPNGAGKTTTIEMIEGLLPATSGQIDVLGLRWQTDANAIRQRIGISLQETRLSERLSVLETITLFRSFYPQGMDPDDVMRSVSLESKSAPGLRRSRAARNSDWLWPRPVGDPDLLFLDEPTTGLDPQSRRQLWDIIRGYRQRGRTVLRPRTTWKKPSNCATRWRSSIRVGSSRAAVRAS